MASTCMINSIKTIFLSSAESIFYIAFRERKGEMKQWSNRERERDRERERNRNIRVRDKHQLAAFLYVPWPGMEPATFQSMGCDAPPESHRSELINSIFNITLLIYVISIPPSPPNSYSYSFSFLRKCYHASPRCSSQTLKSSLHFKAKRAKHWFLNNLPFAYNC